MTSCGHQFPLVEETELSIYVFLYTPYDIRQKCMQIVCLDRKTYFQIKFHIKTDKLIGLDNKISIKYRYKKKVGNWENKQPRKLNTVIIVINLEGDFFNYMMVLTTPSNNRMHVTFPKFKVSLKFKFVTAYMIFDFNGVKAMVITMIT